MKSVTFEGERVKITIFIVTSFMDEPLKVKKSGRKFAKINTGDPEIFKIKDG